jgi:hypothetical protein
LIVDETIEGLRMERTVAKPEWERRDVEGEIHGFIK